MARTQLRGEQIQNTFVYDDTGAAGSAQQTSSTNLEQDLNAIRSALRRHLDSTGSGKWYDDCPILGTGTTKLGLKQAADAIYAQSQQPFAPPAFNYTATPVPANQNYVILSVANQQAPSGNLAIQATTFGAIVAQSASSGSAFAANELTALAGSDALHPKNLVRIHNDADGSPIEDANTIDIFGLLQAESTAVDGAAANDTSGGARVKISFVKINSSTKQFVAAAAADIAGKTINYAFRRRVPLSQVPEGALGGDGAFVDNIGAADVTLTRATSNQAGTGIPVVASVLWQVPNGQSFKVQSASGASDIFAVNPTSGGTGVAVNASTWAVTTTSASTFTQGQQVSTAAQTINVGVTAGQIDSAGLAITATGANPLKLQSGAGVTFRDGYLSGSTFTSTSVPLASGSADWTAYKSAFGEVSIAQALVTSSKSANHRYVVADVTPVLVAAGTNVTGAGSGANLSVQLPDWSMISDPSSNVRCIYNGVILRYGANQAANQDFYAGDNKATGDLKFNFALRGIASGKPDAIALEIFGTT